MSLRKMVTKCHFHLGLKYYYTLYSLILLVKLVLTVVFEISCFYIKNFLTKPHHAVPSIDRCIVPSIDGRVRHDSYYYTKSIGSMASKIRVVTP